MFRSTEEAIVSLDAVDRATDRFVVRVAKRASLRRVARKIEARMKKHFPDGIASVSIEDADT